MENNNLASILESYRSAARSEREKGDYFERLIRVFLQNDDLQKQFYSEVVPFSEWAKANGWKGNDTGIDLVARLSDGSGFAAIQCKFYAPNQSIQKPDIDSFISASSNDVFTRLIIADTTQKEFGSNAIETLDKLSDGGGLSYVPRHGNYRLSEERRDTGACRPHGQPCQYTHHPAL